MGVSTRPIVSGMKVKRKYLRCLRGHGFNRYSWSSNGKVNAIADGSVDGRTSYRRDASGSDTTCHGRQKSAANRRCPKCRVQSHHPRRKPETRWTPAHATVGSQLAAGRGQRAIMMRISSVRHRAKDPRAALTQSSSSPSLVPITFPSSSMSSSSFVLPEPCSSDWQPHARHWRTC